MTLAHDPSTPEAEDYACEASLGYTMRSVSKNQQPPPPAGPFTEICICPMCPSSVSFPSFSALHFAGLFTSLVNLLAKMMSVAFGFNC